LNSGQPIHRCRHLLDKCSSRGGPSIASNILPDLVIACDVRTWQRLGIGCGKQRQRLIHLPPHSYTLDKGIQVSSVCATGSSACVKIVEVDIRSITWIRALKLHRTGFVAGVRFQYGPSPVVGITDGVIRISKVVAMEAYRTAKKEEIIVRVRRDLTTRDDSASKAVSAVCTTVKCIILLMCKTWVSSTIVEGAVRSGRKWLRRKASHATLVPILQVRTHAGKVLDHWDVEALELIRGTNAAELQKLWCVECTSCQDHFFVRRDGARSPSIPRARCAGDPRDTETYRPRTRRQWLVEWSRLRKSHG